MPGKRFLQLKKMIKKDHFYSLDEALNLVKKTAKAKFNESVEIHLKLGIDPKKSDQQVRGIALLPYNLGKTKKIAVFTENQKEAAKKAGAEIVGGKELIEEISKTKKINFDLALATPEIMKDLAKIARILGPKGLMPNPKTETVTTDVKKTIQEFKKGKISFKNDDSGNVHGIIGKVSQEKEKLKENLLAFLEAVKKVKPKGAKGLYIKNITLASTMGPGIKVKI